MMTEYFLTAFIFTPGTALAAAGSRLRRLDKKKQQLFAGKNHCRLVNW